METTTHITWHPHQVARPRGCVVWFTGLSGSGKSTIANCVDSLLYGTGVSSYVLDGDNIRHGLNASPDMLAAVYGSSFAQRFGLGFSEEDRQENIRRIGCVAELFCAAGIIALTAFVSPYRRDRDLIRETVISAGDRTDFVEVFVDTPIEICQARDPKGLYAKARSGKLKGLTGIDAPYEPPLNPEVHLASGSASVAELAANVIGHLRLIEKVK